MCLFINLYDYEAWWTTIRYDSKKKNKIQSPVFYDMLMVQYVVEIK